MYHGNSGASFSLLEAASFWTHVPTDCANFISLVVAVASHNDCVLEFIVDSLLDFVLLGWLTSIALALLRKSDHLLID